MTTLQALADYCDTFCLETILNKLDVILNSAHLNIFCEKYNMTEQDLIDFDNKH